MKSSPLDAGSGAWLLPPNLIRLAQDEVHLWRASLAVTPPEMEKLGSTLTPGELGRAARFRVPEAHARFTAARAILRDILARYLNCKPSSLVFACQSGGKPYLVSPTGANNLEFNLSHSHGLALYGITRSREIGVDVELVRSGVDYERIAARFFSSQESATLQDLPNELRAGAFFCCWTRKEAYIKARGGGLAIPLASFEVSLAPGEPAALLSVCDNLSEPERWSLHALEPAPGYQAALAVEGTGLRLSLWDWQPPLLQPA